MAEKLRDGLLGLGFESIASPALLSNTVTCVRPPPGTDPSELVRTLAEKQNIYISGGLGPLRGKTIRIGTMGTQAEPAVVERLLGALDSLL